MRLAYGVSLKIQILIIFPDEFLDFFLISVKDFIILYSSSNVIEPLKDSATPISENPLKLGKLNNFDLIFKERYSDTSLLSHEYF